MCSEQKIPYRTTISKFLKFLTAKLSKIKNDIKPHILIKSTLQGIVTYQNVADKCHVTKKLMAGTDSFRLVIRLG